MGVRAGGCCLNYSLSNVGVTQTTPMSVCFWLEMNRYLDFESLSLNLAIFFIHILQGTVTILKIPNIYDAFKLVCSTSIKHCYVYHASC